MIRNVVVGRLRDDVGPEGVIQLEDGLAAIAALRLPGRLEI